MNGMEGVLTILLIFGTLFVAIVGTIFIWALKILKGGSSRQSKQLHEEETRIIQQIYQGLSRMEERVEALETILTDQERRKAEEREP